MIILVTESTDGIELTGSGVAISVLEGIFEGGGGGAVDSVNGEVGVVVLDATDVGADATGTATAAVAAHVAAGDPHAGYLTTAEGNAAYDALGAAASAQTAAEGVASTALATHEADTTSVHGIANTANLETTTGSQTKVDAHVNDTSAAHAASAISFSPTGTIAATDVQAAIAEVASEAGGSTSAPVMASLDTVGVTQTLTSATYAVIDSSLDLTLAAQTGDIIEASLSLLVGNQAADTMFNLAVIDGSSATIRLVHPNGTSGAGPAQWYAATGQFRNLGGSFLVTVASGDIVGGNVKLRLVYRTTASRTLYVGGGAAGIPLHFWARNLSR